MVQHKEYRLVQYEHAYDRSEILLPKHNAWLGVKFLGDELKKNFIQKGMGGYKMILEVYYLFVWMHDVRVCVLNCGGNLERKRR